jgi:hypothetical protein
VRLTGSLLALGGLVLLVVGLFMGCGSLFAWNGRHPVEVVALTPGTPLSHVVEPVPGRRYTVSVQVIFDRAAGDAAAKMPLVARIHDGHGALLAETVGWLDPDSAPTVMLGTHPSPRQSDETELVAERIVGAFPASKRERVSVAVDLGSDQSGGGRILGARAVIYDDVIPPSIKGLLGLAAVGALGSVAGFTLLVASFFRGRRRRGGVRRAEMMVDARP